MQNQQPLYTLSSQTFTPTNSFYTIGGTSPIMCSDQEPPTTTTTTTTPKGRSGKKVKVSKRKQVKNACTNCQKACKKCDEGRACQRCVKLGIADSCVDSPRKERLKGVKRGPYKKRQRENVTSDMTQLQTKDTPFYYEQVWDNKAQQQQSGSSDFMFSQEQPLTTTDGFYSSPSLQYYSGTPDYYTSPSTMTTASPASSSILLPQDTLQQILSVDGLMQVPLKQEPIYSDDLLMLSLDVPCSPHSSSSFAWSTPSPTTTSFAPQSTQAIYQQPQQYIPQEQQQQQQKQIPMYWDPSTYDWSLVCPPQSYI